VKRLGTLAALSCIFVAILATWLWQDAHYPHTIYEYHETGETVIRYDGRDEGNVVQAVPISIPNNPQWVQFIRGFAPVGIFILIGLILWQATRNNKIRAHKPLEITEVNEDLYKIKVD